MENKIWRYRWDPNTKYNIYFWDSWIGSCNTWKEFREFLTENSDPDSMPRDEIELIKTSDIDTGDKDESKNIL